MTCLSFWHINLPHWHSLDMACVYFATCFWVKFKDTLFIFTCLTMKMSGLKLCYYSQKLCYFQRIAGAINNNFTLWENISQICNSKKGTNRSSHPEFSSGSLVFIELTDADPPQAGGMTNFPVLEWTHP